jgi:hypothetical protein
MLKRFTKQAILTSHSLRHFTRQSESVLGIARVEISTREKKEEEKPFIFDLKKCWGGDIILTTEMQTTQSEAEFHPRKDTRQWGGGILLN